MNDLIPIGQLEGIAASGEAFPVDFDHAWAWMGYSNKANALKRLKRAFKENTDYGSAGAGRKLDYHPHG